jgi:hypothetical protein
VSPAVWTLVTCSWLGWLGCLTVAWQMAAADGMEVLSWVLGLVLLGYVTLGASAAAAIILRWRHPPPRADRTFEPRT